ncbi:MAG: hypothetical protein ACMUHX_09745 [bacterium]
MPYIPSIFSIGSLTKVFAFPILKPNPASSLLTVFTSIGATIILIKIMEFFFYKRADQNSSRKGDKKFYKNKEIKQSDKQFDFGNIFFYLWGISYILLSILIGLQYDRYIFPVSLLMIYILLSHFSWIGDQKKIFIVTFALIYFVFIYQIVASRLTMDLQWEANYFLLHEGISSYKINGGLGFNQFYSFDYITNLYKNVKVKRSVNWYKFHPLADFFVTSSAGLENKYTSLILYNNLTKKRLFGLLEERCYIYKRKNGHKDPIWI